MTDNIDNSAAKDLLLGIERAERLLEERKGINDDIKDVFLEYKAKGFNPKQMKNMIRLRAIDRETREQDRAEAETYMAALGLL